jgi:protein-tyrosine-phosphatase
MNDSAPQRERKEKKSILFVCCGNRERSVIAEGLLRKELRDKYPQVIDRVTIGSAGIFPRSYLALAKEQGVIFEYPYFGKKPNTYAIEYLAQKGIDVRSCRSRELRREMVVEADLILALDRLIRDEILHFYPETSERIMTFKSFAFGADYPDLDIGNPLKFPRVDDETEAWIWPDGYPDEYIGDIEECLSLSMEGLVDFIMERREKR